MHQEIHNHKNIYIKKIRFTNMVKLQSENIKCHNIWALIKSPVDISMQMSERRNIGWEGCVYVCMYVCVSWKIARSVITRQLSWKYNRYRCLYLWFWSEDILSESQVCACVRVYVCRFMNRYNASRCVYISAKIKKNSGVRIGNIQMQRRN